MNHSQVLLDHQYKITETRKATYCDCLYEVESLKYNVSFLCKITKLAFRRPSLGNANEIEILTNVVHSSIMNVYEHFEENGYLYIIMEECIQPNLAEKLKETGPMNKELALKYFMPICNGILSCHEKGFVHLNLCLENIFLSKVGSPKIINFGQILDYRNDEYAPPEFTKSKPHGDPFKVDIYSLGIILFKLLYGIDTPFSAEELKKKEIPPEIQEVIIGCTNENPVLRPAPNAILAQLKAVDVTFAEKPKQGRKVVLLNHKSLSQIHKPQNLRRLSSNNCNSHIILKV